MAQEEIFVGVDVGKQNLDVYVIPSDEHFIHENNQGGIDKLLERLVQVKPNLVVMEGLEMPLAAALVAAMRKLLTILNAMRRDMNAWQN